MARSLVIGSRGSRLALAQAEAVCAELRRQNPGVELRLEVIKTTGDVKTGPLSVIGGKGVFTKELEDALLDKRIDIAVHSLKDLPTVIPAELRLAAICAREDARDALVLRRDAKQTNVSLSNLPERAVVGTSSPRRAAQLKYLRRDILIKDLRGNVDTRLRKLDEGEYDALILATAGLRRMGIDDRISGIISPDEMLPAVGQGAIALETRVDDEKAIDVAAKEDDVATRLECTAERALLRSLGGGCQLPIAGHATVSGSQIRVEGLVTDWNGTRLVRDYLSDDSYKAEEAGAELGKRLLDRGARLLLNE
jgi:hydroxymethylbilane synthase